MLFRSELTDFMLDFYGTLHCVELQQLEIIGYPTDGIIPAHGKISRADIQEHTQFDTQSLSKFAFSMFWRAMQFAEEQQVPILLDY